MAAAFGLLTLLLAAPVVMAEIELVQPDGLSAPRREWIAKSLAFLKEHPGVPYVEGGAEASGMDCSGAITRLLKLLDIVPPRSAHGQYQWLKESGRLTLVPTSARSADDPVFHRLQPGDLIFWAHDGPDAAVDLRVSHVEMFLGREKDGHPVMIGSSDGRSYRGNKVKGFGIVDYHVPKAGSPTRIVAFGSPLPSPEDPSPDQGNPPPSESLQPKN